MRTRKLLQRGISACYFSYVLPHRSHKWCLLWGICGVHWVMWCSPCKESLCRENAPALQKYTGKEDEKNKRRVFSPLMTYVVFRSSLGLKTRVRKQFSNDYETPLPVQCEQAVPSFTLFSFSLSVLSSSAKRGTVYFFKPSIRGVPANRPLQHSWGC